MRKTVPQYCSGFLPALDLQILNFKRIFMLCWKQPESNSLCFREHRVLVIDPGNKAQRPVRTDARFGHDSPSTRKTTPSDCHDKANSCHSSSGVSSRISAAAACLRTTGTIHRRIKGRLAKRKAAAAPGTSSAAGYRTLRKVAAFHPLPDASMDEAKVIGLRSIEEPQSLWSCREPTTLPAPLSEMPKGSFRIRSRVCPGGEGCEARACSRMVVGADHAKSERERCP